MKPWLKAGLWGGAVLSAVTIVTLAFSFIPSVVGLGGYCCGSVVFFVLQAGVGMLAVFWLPAPRTLGMGVREGALAGLVAGVIDGVATFAVISIAALAGVPEWFLEQLPAEVTMLLQGIDLRLLLEPTLWILSALAAVPLSVVLAIGSGALGGLIYAAVKRT